MTTKTINNETLAVAKQASKMFFSDFSAAHCSPVHAYANGYKSVVHGGPGVETWAELEADVQVVAEEFFVDDGADYSPLDAFEAGFVDAVTAQHLGSKEPAAKATDNVIELPTA